MNKKRKTRPHWYRMFVGECPVCWKDASYRVRVYGKKPKDIEKRYEQLPQAQTYCGCVR